VDLPPGSHHVTVRMWNSAGQSFSVTRTFTVEGTPLTCSTPSMSPGIHVCAPPSGGVVSSPAALSATLRWDGKTITGSRVYVDSNAVFTGVKGQTSISTSVPLKSGGHHLTLRMWNSAGQSFSVSRSFTVQ
jgi:hypothetical protein